MDDKEDEQKCERVNKWRGGLIGDVCAVWQAMELLFSALHWNITLDYEPDLHRYENINHLSGFSGKNYRVFNSVP